MRKVYFDACVFIEVALYQAKQYKAVGDLESAKTADLLIAAAAKGEVEIYTSTLTLAECLRIGDTPPSEEAKEFYRNLLQSYDGPIQLVMPTWQIAERARDFCWVDGITAIRSVDAFHAATSLAMECDEYITCEKFFVGDPDKPSKANRFAKTKLNPILAKGTKSLPSEQVEMSEADEVIHEQAKQLVAVAQEPRMQLPAQVAANDSQETSEPSKETNADATPEAGALVEATAESEPEKEKPDK